MLFPLRPKGSELEAQSGAHVASATVAQPFKVLDKYGRENVPRILPRVVRAAVANPAHAKLPPRPEVALRDEMRHRIRAVGERVTLHGGGGGGGGGGGRGGGRGENVRGSLLPVRHGLTVVEVSCDLSIGLRLSCGCQRIA